MASYVEDRRGWKVGLLKRCGSVCGADMTLTGDRPHLEQRIPHSPSWFLVFPPPCRAASKRIQAGGRNLGPVAQLPVAACHMIGMA